MCIFTYGFISQLGTLIKVSDQTGHFVGFGWVTEFFETHSSGIHFGYNHIVLSCVFWTRHEEPATRSFFFLPFSGDDDW